ncbi:MAG: hypothetical protein DRQ42_01595 [Gammaproteobacteria bacterium]|nr:MAG: hypothetical protein DRQ42_01595 [Gammaproteobacteria bacterium]
MSAINDLKYTAVNITGKALADEYFAWLGDNGGTGNSVMDREKSMLIAKGVAPGEINDMWVERLGVLGHTGSLEDMLYDFWLGGGII